MTSTRTTLPLVGGLAVGAVLQGATALPGYATAAPGWGATVVLSALLLIAQVSVASLAAVRLAGARPAVARTVVWSAIVVVAGTAVAVLVPMLLVPFVVVASAVLSAAAAGRPLRVAATVVRRAPVRALLVVLLSLALSVLGWVAAVASGFFVTGMLGGILMWTFFSLAALVQLFAWARLQRVAAGGAAPAAPARQPAAP